MTMIKTLAMAAILAAVLLVGCAKKVDDQARVSYDASGRLTAQDQDGTDFNMEAKQKASKPSPSTNPR